MAESGRDAGRALGSMADSGRGDGGRVRRFVLEHHPVRGFWVQIDDAWKELRSLRSHTPAIDALLGEAVTASVLLAATLKFQGTLTLQLQGPGLVRLLVAQCTHDFQIRAVARTDDTFAARPSTGASPSFAELVGEGQLLVTIESQERSARYQGIVALQGASLAECLENYFATSEQLPTRMTLAADAERTSGVLVQKMPGAEQSGEALSVRAQQAWEDVQANLARLDSHDLQSSDAEQVLRRTCGQQDGRLFEGSAVRFVCRCSQERVAGLLRALGTEEVHSVLAEQGAVTVTCEFCGRPYRFDAVDVERVFAEGGDGAGPRSLH